MTEYLILTVIMIVLLILILNSKILKLRTKHMYKNDLFIQKEKDNEKTTFLYKLSDKVSESTSDCIKRYTYIKEGNSRKCIVGYTKSFKRIVFNVYMYNMSGKLIAVLEIEETNTSNISKVFDLDKCCKKINIVVKHIDLDDNDYDVVSKVGPKCIVLYCFFLSLFIGLGIYTLGNLLNLAVNIVVVSFIVGLICNIISSAILLLLNRK